MKIPTDLEILNAIYDAHHKDFITYDEEDTTRSSKIYVPINCDNIAKKLQVDPDIVFGRLYYHMEKKYGYKESDSTNVHFFAVRIGRDKHCVNFPLLSSVLAGLRQEKERYWISTTVAVLALVVSSISLGITLTK